MICNAEHFKKLNGIFVYIRENDLRSRARCGINYPQEDRHAYTVDDLGLRKIDDELFAALVKTAAAFALDPLARDLV
jgi:hypothetical protein